MTWLLTKLGVDCLKDKKKIDTKIKETPPLLQNILK